MKLVIIGLILLAVGLVGAYLYGMCALCIDSNRKEERKKAVKTSVTFFVLFVIGLSIIIFRSSM